jgi:hypothetical protein
LTLTQGILVFVPRSQDKADHLYRLRVRTRWRLFQAPRAQTETRSGGLAPYDWPFLCHDLRELRRIHEFFGWRGDKR